MSPKSATPAAADTDHGAADASSSRLTVLVLAVGTVLLLAAGWIGSRSSATSSTSAEPCWAWNS